MKLNQDPNLASELGDKGFRNVREFYSVGRMADGALDVYQSLLR
jgi:hypothetical protein